MPYRTARTIGKRVVPSLAAASGAWALGEVTAARRDDIWPVNKATELLLRFDGTNGSTTFTDDGRNSYSVTANGGASITTSESKYGGASGAFDGSGDYLTLGTSSDFVFLHDKVLPYTIEAWIYPTSVTGRRAILETNAASASIGVLLELDADDLTYNIYRGVNGSFTLATAGAASVATNTWQHIAVSATTSDVKLFVGGVLKSTTTWSLAGSSSNSGTVMTIGGDSVSNVGDFAGYIDDLRITLGASLYDSTFTPPGAL